MKSILYALLVVAGFGAVIQEKFEDKVLILNDKNFDQEIEKYTHVFVDFYVPFTE